MPLSRSFLIGHSIFLSIFLVVIAYTHTNIINRRCRVPLVKITRYFQFDKWEMAARKFYVYLSGVQVARVLEIISRVRICRTSILLGSRRNSENSCNRQQKCQPSFGEL